MTYLRVKNWRRFQHYNHRNPPWIKLHFEILTSPDWVCIDDSAKLLAIVCMLVASRNNGMVPEDSAYLKRVAYLDQSPNFEPLIKCGLLEELPADASIGAHLTASARPETETYRTETEVKNRARISLDELSVEHNAEWLAKKRSEGRYLQHDENFVLEKFKNYCKSRGKSYVDYLAAYRNSFDWESYQPRTKGPNSGNNKDQRARAAVMRAAKTVGIA